MSGFDRDIDADERELDRDTGCFAMARLPEYIAEVRRLRAALAAADRLIEAVGRNIYLVDGAEEMIEQTKAAITE